jgi:dTDP-glucose 4,6-dehydratase
MAAIPSIARAQDADYESANVVGTANVMDLAVELGAKKIIHMSSSTVYGIPASCPIDEDAPLDPGCAYSRSKLRAEHVARGYTAQGLDVTIIRPRVVVGPGRAGIFGLLFGFMRLGLPVPLVGGGDNFFQFTSIDDLVRVCEIVSKLDHEGGKLRIYNIGSDVERCLRADLEELLDVSGSRSRLVAVPSGPVRRVMQTLEHVNANPLVEEQYRIADVDFVLNTGRAKLDIGFSPMHRNCDGLIAAWHWWTEQGGSGWGDIARWWKPTQQNALQKRRDWE